MTCSPGQRHHNRICRNGPAATRTVILLIMGLGMQLVAWPQSFVDGLVARGFRVVRFDNRDVGHSTPMPSAGSLATSAMMARAFFGLPVRPPYSLNDMARDALGLMDALGIGQAHVVGVSMGGMIAQILAIEHPERVKSLTSIMSTTGDRKLPGPKSKSAARAAAAAPARQGGRGPPRHGALPPDRRVRLSADRCRAARQSRARGAAAAIVRTPSRASSSPFRPRRAACMRFAASVRQHWSCTAPTIRWCRWRGARTPPPIFPARACASFPGWAIFCPKRWFRFLSMRSPGTVSRPKTRRKAGSRTLPGVRHETPFLARRALPLHGDAPDADACRERDDLQAGVAAGRSLRPLPRACRGATRSPALVSPSPRADAARHRPSGLGDRRQAGPRLPYPPRTPCRSPAGWRSCGP